MASTMALYDSDRLYVLINIISMKAMVHRGKSITNPSCTLKKDNKGMKSKTLIAYSRLGTAEMLHSFRA